VFGRRQLPRRTAAQRLALEIHDAVERVVRDHPFVLDAWSKHRLREPLVEAFASAWETWPTADLLDLEPETLLGVTAFFEELERSRTWARCTDAMPATLDARYELAKRRLGELADRAIERLGGLPPA
jgi:hypothetical protein